MLRTTLLSIGIILLLSGLIIAEEYQLKEKSVNITDIKEEGKKLSYTVETGELLSMTDLYEIDQHVKKDKKDKKYESTTITIIVDEESP